MKKITFLSLVVATMLFTACGEETKKAASEATTATTEAVKKDTSDAVEAAKAKAAEVAEAAKIKAAELAAAAEAKAAELKAAAEAKATEAVEAVKEKTAEVTEAASTAVAAATSETAAAPSAYAKCKGCHGADGKTQALGKSAVIAGQDKAALIASMNEYKAGTRNVAGMGMLMKGQVASMSDADMEAVAEYLSAVK
ncbi:MAG: c-type cytochrome [Sulfurovum sp.]|nr:c-type cytochrome [Sulfurovum sp.]